MEVRRGSLMFNFEKLESGDRAIDFADLVYLLDP